MRNSTRTRGHLAIGQSRHTFDLVVGTAKEIRKLPTLLLLLTIGNVGVQVGLRLCSACLTMRIYLFCVHVCLRVYTRAYVRVCLFDYLMC